MDKDIYKVDKYFIRDLVNLDVTLNYISNSKTGKIHILDIYPRNLQVEIINRIKIYFKGKIKEYSKHYIPGDIKTDIELSTEFDYVMFNPDIVTFYDTERSLVFNFADVCSDTGVNMIVIKAI